MIVGLHIGKGFVSNAIKFFTKSPFTHAFVLLEIFRIGQRRFYLIFEASDRGVMPRIRTDKYFKKAVLYKYVGENLVGVDACLTNYLENWQGKWYGYFQLIGFMIWYFLKWVFGIVLPKNPIRTGTVCSEFVGEVKKVHLDDC